MNELIQISISLSIPICLGYCILSYLFRRSTLCSLTKLALSYGLGLGCLSIWMLILGILRLPLTTYSIGFPLLFISFVLATLTYIYKKNHINPNTQLHHNDLFPYKFPLHVSFASIIKIIVLLLFLDFICLNLFYTFWYAFNMPIFAYDAIATIAYKAKVIWTHQQLPDLNVFPHPSYPLFIPFIQAWIGFNLNYWSDQYINIIFPICLTSYLMIHYRFLSEHTNKTWGLLGCVILLSSNLLTYHAGIAYRDLFLMYFNCVTIVLLIQWSNKKDSSYLILASFFSGFTTFTKLEGTAYFLIHIVIFLFLNFKDNVFYLKKKWFNLAKFIFPSFIICFGYHLFKIMTLFANDTSIPLEKMEFEFSLEKLALFPTIIKVFLINLFYSNNWNIFWFLFLIGLIHLTKKFRRLEIKILFLSLLSFFCLYIMVSLFTTNYIWIAGEKSATGLSRLFLHFFPLAVLLLVILIYPELEDTSDVF